MLTRWAIPPCGGSGWHRACPYTVRSHAAEGVQSDVEQPPTVDVHEVAADVHLQHVASFLIVLALLPYMMLQTVYAIVGPPVAYAAIGVGYEGALQHLMGVVEIEMVNDTVAEIGGKHLAPLRLVDDKTGGGLRFVTPLPQFVAKCSKVGLSITLKPLLIRFLPLVPTGIIVSLV